jgi:acyl-CoA synthetase (NDP forming)
VLLGAATRLHLGLSAFVSVGNKADVSSNDLLQYWEEDAGTNVILLYLESFGNPRRFARIARRVSRRKPIVAVKGGRTQAGWRAAGSHTAALAAPNVAVDALFRQTGIIRAETLEEMFDLAGALSRQPLPKGRRVAIVTNAGGPGILCADACEAGGLVVSALAPETNARLAGWLPSTASLDNPIDMIASASPEQYRRTIETVLAATETDMLIVLYVSLESAVPEAVVEAIRAGVAAGRALGGTDKPVLVCLMAEGGITAPLALEKESLPTYVFPEAAARVLSHMAEYAEWRAKPEGMVLEFADSDFAMARELCETALKQRGTGWLDAEETRRLLAAVGLPILPGGVARSPEEAAKLALGLGFPVAVKLASRHLVHKTEVGGVHLNLMDEAAVRHAYEQIRDRLLRENNLYALEGVLVQPMLSGGVEVMVGMTQDPVFGPLIGFGLGGVHVEILRDVCFRITPLTDRDAREMVQGIRGARLLQGYRGHPPADLVAVEDVLLRVSRLVDAVPEISELDLNPIFAFPPGQGCRIVDARIKVTPS